MVLTPKDLLESEGLLERGFFDEVEVPGSAVPVAIPGRPFPGFGWTRSTRLSEPGADTAAALAAWGVSA